MRLIFVEHAMAARAYAPHMQAQWPSQELIIFCMVPNGLTKGVFPRGLAYSDYPLVMEPDFRPTQGICTDGSYTAILKITGAGLVKQNVSFEEAGELFRAATDLTFLGGWDYTSVWGMEMLQKHFLPGVEQRPHQVICNSWAYDDACVKRALESPRDSSDPEYLLLSNAAKVKRYFDFNFAVNSFPILGGLYREVSKLTDAVGPEVFASEQAGRSPGFIGRNSLLVLQHAAEVEHLPANLSSYLECWKGTGKYQPQGEFYEGLGTSLARQMVIHDLLRARLIQTLPGEKTAITDLGRLFVSKLHKDSYDRDLPFRIREWMGSPFAQVRPQIDAYILQFFRKQKRFQRC